MMTGVTMCSGIGAPECAALGLPVKWLACSEIEPFPAAVHATRFPGVQNVGDMTKVDWQAYRGLVDMVVAGTPCQAFSVAGLRRGLSDERGNLTLQFVRAVDAIDPLFTVWENVPGVLSSKDNAFGAFLAGICGDDEPLLPDGRWPNAGVVVGPTRSAAWRVLDAQYFGVAQRRRRVFVVACPRGGPDPAQVLFEPAGVQRHSAPRREAGEGAAVGALAGTSPGGGWRIGADEAAAGHAVAVSGGDAVVAQPYAVANCLTARMHKGLNTTLDEGQTPVLAFDPKRDLAPHGSVEPRRIASPLTATDHKDPQIVAFHPTQDPISSADVTHALGTGSKQGCATVAVAVTGDIAHALNTANNGKMSSEDGTGRGVPTVAVAFQSSQSGVRLDDGHATLDSNNGSRRHNGVLHALGLHENQRAEVTQAASWTVSEASNGFAWQSDVAPTIQATPPTDGMRQQYGVTVGTAVRRLTPTECERLQGFPEVTKTCIINVWHSSDLHANFASAATPSPRSQKSALSADGNASQSCVSAAGQSSLTPPQDLDLPVALRVRISSGRQEVEILSAGKLIGSAVIAAGQGASLLHTHRDVFVRLAALLTTTAERTTSSGKEASPPYTTPFIVPLNGRKRVNVSGQEIEELASDAGLFTKKASDCLRFTTSQSGPSSQNCDLILTTSSSCVAAATASFIPTETRRASSYAVIVEVVTGWTDVVHRGKPAADGPRYKAIGNSMAVPVMRFILRRAVVEGMAHLRRGIFA